MDYRSINTERQFKDCTSMSKEKFVDLCKYLNEYYLEENGHTYQRYVEEQLVHETPRFQNLEDALFFVLFQKKNDLVYGALGSVFG